MYFYFILFYWEFNHSSTEQPNITTSLDGFFIWLGFIWLNLRFYDELQEHDVTGWGFRPADAVTSPAGLSFQTSAEAARSAQVERRIRRIAALRRASAAPEDALTYQECPNQRAEGRGDAVQLQPLENHPGGGQSGPSHRCEPPHTRLGKCCVGAVLHDWSNGRYSFINREIQMITFKGESFIFVFHLLVALTSTCQWRQVDHLRTKPAHPINCVNGCIQCMEGG